ncbi:MAG: c-type cytochrome [Telluria sp.]|nr:c-type cytochrome [Telluria sp.]
MNRDLLIAWARKLAPRRVRRGAFLLSLCLAGVLPQAVAAAPIRPAVLYHNYCSVCHGDKGDGKSRAQNSLNPPPRDFTTPDSAQLSRARMISSIQNGRPGTAMTGWKAHLNLAETEALVDYMRNTFMAASMATDGGRGRVVYSKNCSVCHGEKGDGKSRAQFSLMPPPRDFTAPGARAELSEQRMITSVTYGRADTAMAGFKHQLSGEDIAAVVAYIRSGFMNQAGAEGISGVRHGRRQPNSDGSAAPAAARLAAAPAVPVAALAPDMRAPMPGSLKGDVAKGGAFYMSNCATCHGSSGDGRGPRAYFINPKPRNFLHPAARQQFNRVAVFNAVSAGKPGTEMPAWSPVLTPQEIADVSEFVFQRFLQPGSAGAKQTAAGRR